MNDLKRFVISVDANRDVTVTAFDGAVVGTPRPLHAPVGGLSLGEVPPRYRFLGALCDDDGELDGIWKLFNSIFLEESYKEDDLKSLGKLLFDKLVGDDNWSAIRAKAGASAHIELALLWDESLQELHRFNWEMMYGPDGYLAAERVAITRLVMRTPSEKPEQFLPPPKILFAAGTRVTDKKVRPGAEYFGLLRQLRHRGLTIHPRILQLTSAPDLRTAMEKFAPHVVHFICHGDIDCDAGKCRGFLELQKEDKKGIKVQLFAEDLLKNLKVKVNDKIKFPLIVVLSACYSAAHPGAAGVDRVGSLAAELVKAGIPIVVGMSGQVSDTACRLFTRRFGEALVMGEPLVAATAEGRWAALIDGIPETVDWAFPTLFMAQDVDAAYVPVKRKSGEEDPGVVLRNRIKDYGVPDYPVLCGRYEFFRAYERMLDEGWSVLAIWTKQDIRGIGRTRLLQELAAQAMCDGHVPCLVTPPLPRRDDKHRWYPRFVNPTDLAIEILRAIAHARKHFALDPPLESGLFKALEMLLEKNPPDNYDLVKSGLEGSSWKRYDYIMEHMRDYTMENARGLEVLSLGDVTPRNYLAEDFAKLIQDARDAHETVGDDSRVILLLDEVHDFGGALKDLLDTWIDRNGLGTDKERVPVILCYSLTSNTGETLKEAVERKSRDGGWWSKELAPFSQVDDEDMLAYEQFMLHLNPNNEFVRELSELLGKTPAGSEAAISFAYNRRPPDPESTVEKWKGKFRRRIRGIPINLDSDRTYVTLEDAYDDGFLEIADDDIKLSKLRGKL
jgi:hypothetical protein